MKWKYIKIGILVLLAILIIVPAYQYYGSIDWAKKHSAKINALPVLGQADDSGLFRLPVGDFEFFARVAGLQNDGPGLILLHGFPESSIAWDPLLEKAAAEGFRVIAFDQRGYSPGARPEELEEYHIDKLTEDVLAVADKVGFDQFHLAGHDWGSAVGWNVSMNHPERVLSWSALSIPHIGLFFDAVLTHPEQQKRSSYIHQLRIPIIPEYMFVSNGQKRVREGMAKIPAKYLDEYLAIQAEKGATTAMLNWYRALEIDEVEGIESLKQKIKVPTLFIWGTEDGVVAPEIIPDQKELIEAPYEEVALESGHSLMQFEEEAVVRAILSHLKRNSSEKSSENSPENLIK
ncbi:MAG: alpha/beta hydrolase [Bacteroidia bacterium]|nr:alpha/beta hydrolase [Bacteroidia bacterium]